MTQDPHGEERTRLNRLQGSMEALEARIGENLVHQDRRLAELETNMLQAAEELRRMSSHLSSQLDRILNAHLTGNTLLVEGVETQKGILDASVSGFASNGQRLLDLDSSVKEGTLAAVQSEYLRLRNEAKAPKRLVEDFSHEIEERFMVAIQALVLNRRDFDALFKDVLDAFDSKMRLIGQHIFEVLEEDFRDVVEKRLEIPRSAYQELALDVDRLRLEERASLLEEDLESFRKVKLDPLLRMHSDFESMVASRFASASDIAGGLHEVLALVRRWADDRTDVVLEACIGRNVSRLEMEGIGGEIEHDERWAGIRDALRLHASGTLPQCRPLSEDELAKLRWALERLSVKGLIDASLLPGFTAYIDTFGLNVDGLVVESLTESPPVVS